MRRFRTLWHGGIVAPALLLGALPAYAATVVLPLVGVAWSTSKQGSEASLLIDPTGAAFGTSGNPVVVTGGSSTTACGGVVCAKDSSLGTINTTLGAPFQAGGAISNTTFAATQSGNWNVGRLTGFGQNNSITRASNTTAYAANELVCLNTSVTPCAPIQVTVAGANAATGTLGNVKLGKTGSSLTNANFTLWFYSASPTVTSKFDASGYVGPFAADLPNFIGSYTCNAMQATSDGSAQAWSACTPSDPQGWEQYQAAAGQTYVYALISVTAAYTPISAEVFTIYANSYRDK